MIQEMFQVVKMEVLIKKALLITMLSGISLLANEFDNISFPGGDMNMNICTMEYKEVKVINPQTNKCETKSLNNGCVISEYEDGKLPFSNWIPCGLDPIIDGELDSLNPPIIEDMELFDPQLEK
jgi:hypothetical protein